MLNELQNWLASLGLSAAQAATLAQAVAGIGILVLGILADILAKRVLLRAVRQFAKRTANDYDDVLVRHRVFQRLSHLAPAVVIWAVAPFVFDQSPALLNLIRRGLDIYVLLVIFFVLAAVLKAGNEIYQRFPVAHKVPIRGYLQVVHIIAGLVIGILVVSSATGLNPWGLFTGLGALTAVLLLIFKDTILGLVAGVQLVANDMVRPGDWIEMPKYGADGDVIDITLNTVKVRNWDKTITTIPTYALISDSFRNWRGMSESGGRRIKRSIAVDLASVRFCTPEMIERFSKIDVLRDYIRTKQAELAAYNQKHGTDESVEVNGRRMTNLGTFRAYLVAYLRHHPKIHQDMTFLVRQLQPTDKGIPLEIYVFSNDQVWANYEAIQADIFDHILAAMPAFDLRPFQGPTGHDVVRAADAMGALRQTS